MHTAILLTTLALIALQACSYAPTTRAPASSQPARTTEKAASPSPKVSTAPNPAGGIMSVECAADFEKFNVRKDTTLDYDEYVDGRYGEVRFVKAPTAQEEAAMKAGFRKEAETADADKDGKLTHDEFATTCSR